MPRDGVLPQRAGLRVTDAGGEVVLGKSPIPTMGWMARFRDSEGNTIGLFQEDTSVPMPEGGMG